MSTPDEDAATRLPCGRDPIDVVDDARSGRSDEHERSCSYCQGAIDSADTAVRGAAALRAHENDIAVPETLLAGVMRTVWSELRRGSMLPLDVPGGAAFVASHVVTATVEAALEQLPDLQVYTCSVSIRGAPADDDAGDDTTAGAATNGDATTAAPFLLAITAAGAYGVQLMALADRARTHVGAVLDSEFGWTGAAVDIDLVDLFVTDARGTAP